MAKDYPYIRAWGEMMGSFRPYILGEVDKARRTGAPHTAIYERDGTWHTIEGVTNGETRHYFMVRGLMTPDWEVPDSLKAPA